MNDTLLLIVSCIGLVVGLGMAAVELFKEFATKSYQPRAKYQRG